MAQEHQNRNDQPNEDEELRFIIDGQPYRASRRSIKARLMGIRPEHITKNYVMVDGRAYPAKQVFSVGFGLPKMRFTTQRAMASLARLGFEVGEIGGATGLSVDEIQDQFIDHPTLRSGGQVTADPGGYYVVNTFAPDGERWQIWFKPNANGRYEFERAVRFPSG